MPKFYVSDENMKMLIIDRLNKHEACKAALNLWFDSHYFEANERGFGNPVDTNSVFTADELAQF